MELTGLTERQVELLDTMWEIEEFEELELWMATLCKGDRQDAVTLQNLVILEQFEAMLTASKYPEANRVIDQFRLTK